MPERLRTNLHLTDDRATLCLEGELDLATTAGFSSQAEQIAETPITALELDVEALTFMDVAGLHGLLNVQDSCLSNACKISLTAGRSQVRRLLQVTALRDEFPLAPARTECEDGAGGPATAVRLPAASGSQAPAVRRR